MMPIPAETFMVSTSHSSQNCGVLCAWFRWTWRVAIIAFCAAAAGGVHPAGLHPDAGTR